MSEMTPEEIIADLMEKTESESVDMMMARVLYDYYTIRDLQGTYSVYVQINESNYITAIDSSAFITDTTLWLKVDEGCGELYKYARVKYCPKGLYEDGFYNYKLVGGAVVYSPQFEAPTDHNELSPTEQYYVASRRYEPGELICIQSRMYETITIIFKDSQIIPGSNVNEITLEEYINRKVEEALGQ